MSLLNTPQINNSSNKKGFLKNRNAHNIKNKTKTLTAFMWFAKYFIILSYFHFPKIQLLIPVGHPIAEETPMAPNNWAT